MWYNIPATCFVALSLLCLNEALRILVVFPMSSKSHSILGQGVVNNLLSAGHEVVHITSYPKEKPVKNLTEIDVSYIGNKFREQAERFDAFKLKNMVGKGNMGESFLFLYFTYEFNKQFLEDAQLQALLSDPNEKFDLVILEWFFAEGIAGIGPVLQCPFLWVGSTEVHWQLIRVIDEIPNPAYNVELFSTSIPPLTFWERTVELWKMLKKYLIVNLLIVPFEKSVYNSVFPAIAEKRGVPVTSYEDAVYNGSMLLINSHPSVGTPYRLPQNAKYIAGYHIDRKIKALPEDLQKIMDEAKHGVVYFSMGSNVKSMDMSDEMKDKLLSILGKLKQQVIWKFEGDLKNVPANIHLVKWAPQLSILSHPNLKLFITHGGQLSTTESIHFGVPVIGVPVLGDQYVNMNAVVAKGFGIMVKLEEDMPERLGEALKKMLSNPVYKQKALELSAIYHDRMSTPGEELVYWAEHVVRTRGAPHLRSPALMVPWYQKLYLDLAVLLILITYVLYYAIKSIKNTRKNINKKTHERKKKI